MVCILSNARSGERKCLLIYDSQHESIICIQEAIGGQSEDSRDRAEVGEGNRDVGAIELRVV